MREYSFLQISTLPFEVHAELAQNVLKNSCCTPGFPASATYDDASHGIVAGLRENFRETTMVFRGTIAKISRSPL